MAGSDDSDQAHDPGPAVSSINRTYHPIINGEFLLLLLIFHLYSRIHFQGQPVTNMGTTFHTVLIHLHANLTADQITGLLITTGSNSN